MHHINTERISDTSKINCPSFSETLPNTPGAIGRSVNIWSPVVTGDWATDCARGRAYADEALSLMRETKNPTYLGHIIKSMIGAGVYGGVEVGFLQRFGEEALKVESSA